MIYKVEIKKVCFVRAFNKDEAIDNAYEGVTICECEEVENVKRSTLREAREARETFWVDRSHDSVL